MIAICRPNLRGIAFGVVAAFVAASPVFAANDWVNLPAISPTTSLSAGHLCYTDGRDLVCNTATPYITSGGLIGIGIVPMVQLEVSGTISATHLVGDGSGITGITAANISGLTNDRIISGSTGMVANSATNIISITTAGVTTGYFDTVGRLVVPGISLTQNYGVSSTAGYFSGKVGIGASPGSEFLIVNSTAYNNGIKITGSSANGSGLALENTSSGGKKYAIFSGGSSNGLTGGLGIYDVTSNTYSLAIDASGNVGIGTSSPNIGATTKALTISAINNGENAALELVGNRTTDAANAMVRFYNSSSEIGRIYSERYGADNSGIIRISTANAGSLGERMRIMPDGSIGIGTQAPATSLTVVGEVQVSSSGVACGSTTAGAIRYQSGSLKYCNGSAFTTLSSGSGTPGGVSGSIQFNSNGSFNGRSDIVVDASGRVGIGTSNPSTALEISPTDGSGFALKIDYANMYAKLSANQLSVFNSPLSLQAASTSNTLINANGGNVGVGTSAPSSTLTVSSTNNITSGSNLADGVGALAIRNSLSGAAGTLGLLLDTNQIEQISGTSVLYLNYSSAADTVLNVGGGDVGVGVPAPNARFEVSGTISGTLIQVGAGGGASCDSAHRGAMRYSTTSSTMEYCNSTAWTSMGPSATSVPAFSVNKGGTDQTVTAATLTKLTWNTEQFDTNNNFASDKFTPTIAGKYLITVQVRCKVTSQCQALIYKNGAAYTQTTNEGVAAGASPAAVTVGILDMNGTTDYVEAYVYNGEGTAVDGSSARTFFNGTLIASGNGLAGGGSTSPGGNNTNIQYNSSGGFAGTDNLAWVNGTNTVSVTGTVSATYGYFKYISATNGGLGVSALASLTDVSVSTTPMSGGILTYASGKWQAVSPSQILSTTTMASSFPDAIQCNITSPTYIGDTYLYLLQNGGGYVYYVWPFQAADVRIAYSSSDGSFSSYAAGITTSNCNVSLSSLYAAGRAFNFIGNIGSTGSTALGDRITSGTTAVTTNSATNTISLTVNNVTTGYINSAGLLVVPGISLTQNYGVSSTTGYFSGKVGIGTASPASNAILHILGGTTTGITPNAQSAAIFEGGTDFGNGNVNVSILHGTGKASALVFGDPTNAAAGQVGYLSSNNNLYFSTQATQRMTIVSTGEVGIGTATPATSLTVVGEVQVSNSGVACSASTKGAIRYNNPSSTVQYCNSTAWTDLGTSATSPVAFAVDKGGTDQTLTASTWTKLSFSHEDFDTNNNFVPCTTNCGSGAQTASESRFTPTVPGKYLVAASVYCNGSGLTCYAGIYKNGVMYRASGPGGSINNVIATVTAIVSMNGTTDYLEAWGYTGGSVYGTTSQYTYFQGALLGPQSSGGGSTSPGGNSNDIQYNSGGNFAGADNFAWVNGTNTVSVTGTVSATYGYFKYISATNGLVNASGDRITSNTTSVVAQTGGVISITNAGTTYGYFNSNGVLVAPGISATTNLTSVTTLYASGKVGIGTATTTEKLEVIGAIKARGTATTAVASATTIDYASGYGRFITNGPDASTQGGFQFNSVSSDGSLNTNPFVITPGGNVGIGTTSPNYELQLNNASGHAIMQMTNAATGSAAGDGGYIGYLSGSTDMRIYNFENDAIGLYTNNAQRMTITGLGSVGIGTAGPNTSLTVVGEVQVSNSGVACSASTRGGIRYSGTSLQYCNSSSWTTLTAGTSTPGGPSGSIQFNLNGGTLSGTAAFTFLNNDIGIGTSSPFHNNTFTTVTISGTNGGILELTNQGSLVGRVFNQGNNVYLQNYQNGNLYLGTYAAGGGTNRMMIDGSGNVGIGTSAPGVALDISSSAGLRVGLLSSASLYTVVNQNHIYSNNGPLYLNWIGTSNTIINGNGGNVGIGTNNPIYPLQVSGTGIGIASVSPTLFLTESDSGGNLFQITADGNRLSMGRWNYPNTLNVDGTGKVGIGVTDPYGALTVYRSGADFTNAAGNTAQLEVRAPTGTSTDDAILGFHIPGVLGINVGIDSSDSYKFKIGGWVWGGGVYLSNGATSWSALSDARVKANVRELSVLSRLDAYRAVSFDWKKSGKHDIGVIAQEIYKIFPEVVDKGTNTSPTAKEGDKGLWGVQYDKLGALALEAAKELKADNDNLRGQLKVLKADNDNIHREIDELREAVRVGRHRQ